jgi:simple sugar transport system ATP-binding protein
MATKRTPLLEAIKISKSFSTVKALQEVDFTINTSEVVGLVGDNGAGKSTLIKILSGVHQPDGGQVLFQGKDIKNWSPEVARELGVETVYQDLALVEQMSIVRNFFLGKEIIRNIGPLRFLYWKRMIQLSGNALKEIGISLKSSSEDVSVLSGGEKQAIAIARAVFFGVKVLILDEPTASLSIKEASKVIAYVTAAREQGLGIVFVTHNLYHVYPIADRIVLVERGLKKADYRKGEVTLDEVTRMVAGEKKVHYKERTYGQQ